MLLMRQSLELTRMEMILQKRTPIGKWYRSVKSEGAPWFKEKLAMTAIVNGYRENGYQDRQHPILLRIEANSEKSVRLLIWVNRIWSSCTAMISGFRSDIIEQSRRKTPKSFSFYKHPVKWSLRFHMTWLWNNHTLQLSCTGHHLYTTLGRVGRGRM